MRARRARGLPVTDPACHAHPRELSPKCEEWGSLCSSMQVKAPEAGDGDWWTEMEQVYDFQSQFLSIVGAAGCPLDAGVVVDGKPVSSAKPAPVSAGAVSLTAPTSGSGCALALSTAVALGLGVALGVAASALAAKRR